MRAFKLRRQLRIGRRIAGEEFRPGIFSFGSAHLGLTPVCYRIVGNYKALVLGKSEELLGRRYRFGAQRLAMRLVAARLGAAIADDRPHRDQRRPAGLSLCCFNGRLNRRKIVAVGHALHMPVIGLKPLRHIVVVAQAGRAVQRDQVVVIEHDQLAQAQCSGQCAGFVADAFHQVAVAQQSIGVMIHHLKAGPVVHSRKVLLRHRHAHSHANTLSQRSCGRFHAVCIAVFGVSGRPGVPLPEALQVVQRHIVPGEKQCGIEQCRCVSVRQHKAVPVRPL